MPTDTWGIPGRTFLLWYGVFAVAAYVAALVLRAIVTRATGPVDEWEPNVEELAYFTGKDPQPVLATVAALRTSGAVAVNADHTIRVIGPAPAGSSALTRAVYRAVQRPGTEFRDILSDDGVRDAVCELRENLVRHRWLVPFGARTMIRLTGLPVLAALGLAVARILAGSRNDRPVGYLIMIAIGVFFSLPFVFNATDESRRARRRLKAIRARHATLDPRRNRAPVLVGASGVAFAVALFGSGVLVSAEPALAPTVADWMPGSTGGGSSSGCGGGGGGCGGGGGGCGG